MTGKNVTSLSLIHGASHFLCRTHYCPGQDMRFITKRRHSVRCQSNRCCSDLVESQCIATMRLTWREICTGFDTIHLSWDPSLFPRQFHFHGLVSGSSWIRHSIDPIPQTGYGKRQNHHPIIFVQVGNNPRFYPP